MSILLALLTLSAPPAGKLVIAGGGRLPQAVTDEVTQRVGDGVLVVIPTASDYADRPEADERYLRPWREDGVGHAVLLHTRDRKRADEPDFSETLTTARGVWLSGGDQRRIAAAYAGTLVEKRLRELLARGGVVGGTSAGAAVQSQVMITGGRTEADVGAGFDLLPGAIVDQHFLKRDRLARLLDALGKHPSRVGVGIDEATAAVFEGGRLRVVGDSHVVLIGADGRGARVLQSGDAVAWPLTTAPR